MAMVAVAAIMPFLLTGTAAGKYSDGTGEPNDPYRIATAEDLNDIGNHEEDWNKHFILVNDVNLAQYTGTQFNRIGTSWNNAFTGVFDGNDHKICNFTWDSNGISSVGLFGCVGSGGQIKNLGMENVDVNGKANVGGLVGDNWGSVSNCYSTGDVKGDLRVGSLVGFNLDGSVSNCYSTGDVSGSDRVGGLVGANNLGSISNCYATGDVSGGGYVGGLVGRNIYCTVSNCYSTGDVSGDAGVGGLVGRNYVSSVSNCYSSGDVNGGGNVGGLVGENDDGGVSNCFWDRENQTHGVTESIGENYGTVTNVSGFKTAQMQTKSTFTDAGWDFVEVWGIGEHQTYPYLRTEPAGDSNHDKKVDLVDLAILASHWLENAER